MERIVNSLLETDAYKFSMGQGIYHQFSDYKTTWSFHCRNTDVFFTPEMVEEIKRQIKMYCDLRFSEEELAPIMDKSASYVDLMRLALEHCHAVVQCSEHVNEEVLKMVEEKGLPFLPYQGDDNNAFVDRCIDFYHSL